MEQKKRNPIRWFQAQRLSHKIMLSVGVLIFCSNLIIMLLVTRAATSNLRQKTYEQLQDQLSITLSTVSSAMSDVTDLMVNLSTTSGITDFTENGVKYQNNYLQIVNSANESMRLLRQASNMVDYVALLRTDSSEYLYVGEPIPDKDVQSVFLRSFNRSNSFTDTVGVSGDILTRYYDNPMLNLYYPMYRNYGKRGYPAVVLVVGINTRKMFSYVVADNKDLNLRILNPNGIILTSNRFFEIGSRADYADEYVEQSGQLTVKDSLIAYQTSKDGLWVADGVISQHVLFAGLRRMESVIVWVILLVMLIGIVVTALLSNRFYSPMEEVLYKMNLVSEGDLDAKMRDYVEEDFQMIAERFNGMTTAVKGLIESVHRREQENTEIRLNALQSQIKPHFLYNTLECIHWQALLAGDLEVSKMVMALSRYYRLCLSKGQDIVPLSQEIEHTESYITIQNIRFDNILEVDYQIPPELMTYSLPKITLQPLVENAIYHGIKPQKDIQGKVVIRGEVQEDAVLLTVADNGRGMQASAIRNLNKTIGVIINDGSYGVKNVHQRLEIRYGKGYGLHYDSNEDGGVTVTIRLPAISPSDQEE